MSYVYFILDRKSKALKIGKANDVLARLNDLQVGNSNTLELIHTIQCYSESHSFQLERQLHQKYENLHLRGEWFHYDEQIFAQLLSEGTIIQAKQKRESLIVSTLFGDEEYFGPKNSPKCYFYSHLTAQILTNFEDAKKMKVPFRTMAFPTFGKSLLLPYTTKTDRVFISTKKHQENIILKRFLDSSS